MTTIADQVRQKELAELRARRDCRIAGNAYESWAVAGRSAWILCKAHGMVAVRDVGPKHALLSCGCKRRMRQPNFTQQARSRRGFSWSIAT
jgi:hypothetical protein